VTPVALEWIARFRRYLSSERRLSAHTDQSYARDLAALVKFCDREGIDDWSALDSQHVRRFAAHSHGSGLAPRSIQRRLSALRSFYNFLLREAASESARTARVAGPAHTAQATEPAERRRARITGNPATEVRAPKATRRLPQTLDADQMARLLQMPAGGDRLDSRDRAMMELLYSSGLRLAELVGLDVSSLDLKDGVVHVLGKGRKARIVPVGRMALRALRSWLRSGPRSRARVRMLCSWAVMACGSERVRCRSAWRCGRAGRGSGCMCTRTSSATPSPHICSSRVGSCAGCRSCSGTPISPPRRSTRTLTSSILPASTTLPTRGRVARLKHTRWRTAWVCPL